MDDIQPLNRYQLILRAEIKLILQTGQHIKYKQSNYENNRIIIAMGY